MLWDCVPVEVCAIQSIWVFVGLLFITVVPEVGAVSYLHGYAGPCSIEVAYQAAEANHPDRAEKARRLQKNFSLQETG